MKPVRRRTKIDFRSNTWKDNQMKKMLLACLATSSLVPSAFAQSTAIPAYYPEDYGEIVAAAAEENDIVVYSNISHQPRQQTINMCQARHPDRPATQTPPPPATKDRN